MATGTVKWFNDAKGFGFITPDVSGFHVPPEFGVDDLSEGFGCRFSGMDIPVLRFAARRAPGGVIA